MRDSKIIHSPFCIRLQKHDFSFFQLIEFTVLVFRVTVFILFCSLLLFTSLGPILCTILLIIGLCTTSVSDHLNPSAFTFNKLN